MSCLCCNRPRKNKEDQPRQSLKIKKSGKSPKKSGKSQKPKDTTSLKLLVDFVGAGVLRKFGAEVLGFFFWLPSSRQTECSNRFFFCADFAPIFGQIFGAQIFAPIFAQIFGAQTFAQIFTLIFCRFFFDILAPENRCSRVTQKCAENLRKNLRRPNGPARGGGVPLPSPLSRADSTSHNRR